MVRDLMADLDRARASGKRLGRPRTTPFTVQRIRLLWKRLWCVRDGAATRGTFSKVAALGYRVSKTPAESIDHASARKHTLAAIAEHFPPNTRKNRARLKVSQTPGMTCD
jgi:hypothetical protein